MPALSEATSITFHGPDGCGKSTIAAAVVDTMRSSGHDTRLLGASSYKSWLTPSIAADFGCDAKLLEGVNLSPADRTCLYEDIAVACYGVMGQTGQRGTSVVIDSDPYIKRMIWARLELPANEYPDYVGSFESKMTDRLGALAPQHAVRVSLGIDTTRPSHEALYRRIQTRGKVSGYDPDNVAETERIITAADQVWSAVSNGKRFKAAGTRLHEVVNSGCPTDELPGHVAALVTRLTASIIETPY